MSNASKSTLAARIPGMRKPRELQDGGLYHVTARANRKEMILDNRGMKELFLQVIARARKRYDFRIENFTLMGNHFHLMIRPGRGESHLGFFYPAHVQLRLSKNEGVLARALKRIMPTRMGVLGNPQPRFISILTMLR